MNDECPLLVDSRTAAKGEKYNFGVCFYPNYLCILDTIILETCISV